MNMTLLRTFLDENRELECPILGMFTNVDEVTDFLFGKSVIRYRAHESFISARTSYCEKIGTTIISLGPDSFFVVDQHHPRGIVFIYQDSLIRKSLVEMLIEMRTHLIIKDLLGDDFVRRSDIIIKRFQSLDLGY